MYDKILKSCMLLHSMFYSTKCSQFKWCLSYTSLWATPTTLSTLTSSLRYHATSNTRVSNKGMLSLLTLPVKGHNIDSVIWGSEAGKHTIIHEKMLLRRLVINVLFQLLRKYDKKKNARSEVYAQGPAPFNSKHMRVSREFLKNTTSWSIAANGEIPVFCAP